METTNMTSCRTCLGPLELPINLFGSSYSNLLDVLQRLLAFQVFVEGIEFKICRHCQGKLIWASEFQVICLKSLEPLRNSIKTERNGSPGIEQNNSNTYNDVNPLLHVEVALTRCHKIEELIDTKHKNRRRNRKERKSVDDKQINLSLQYDNENDRSLSPFGDNSDIDFDYKPSDDTSKKRKRQVKVKTTRNKRTKFNISNTANLEIEAEQDNLQCRTYLKQFPINSILQAIKEAHSYTKDVKNIKCIYCSYVGKHYLVLRSHVRKKHKHVENWCANCNIQVDDLQEHRLRCNVWTCKFCKRYFPRMKGLTRHLKLHCRSNTADIPFRLQQFPANEVLAAIGGTRFQQNINRRQCVVCNRICKEVGHLRNHMARAHKTEFGKWCMFCNMITQDLHTHKEADNCNGERCVFCDRTFTKRKFLTFHLRQHCREELFRKENGSLIPLDEATIITTTVSTSSKKSADDVIASRDLTKVISNTAVINKVDDHKFYEENTSNYKTEYKRTESLKEETPLVSIEDEPNLQDNDDDQDNEEDRVDSPTGDTRVQFPFSEVLQAIKDAQSSYTDLKKRQCIYCDFLGSTTHSLWCHLRRTHKNKDIYNWCIICNLQTEDLQKHKDIIQCNIWTCKFCQKTCTAMKHLTRHLKTHCRKGKANVPSLRTVRQFPADTVLDAIFETHFDRKRRQCVVCNVVLEEVGYLQKHISGEHSAQYDNWCMYCNIIATDLQRHKEVDKCHGERCKFCDRTFSKMKYLRSHLRTHSRQNLLYAKCKICKEKYCEIHAHLQTSAIYKEKFAKTVEKEPSQNIIPADAGSGTSSVRKSSDLDLHDIISKNNTTNTKIRKNAKSTDKKILCPCCGKIFKTASGADYHISSHYGDPKFKCSTCGKCFYKEAVLKTHEKKHSEIKEFVCHICGKGSTQKQAHKKHLETHDVSPVQCPICDKEFYRAGVLKMHMRHHTGENQFHCIPCGKSFHIKSRLRLHMEMHTNVEHMCTVCGKVLKSTETLRKHKLIHKENKRYKCSICPYKGEQAHQLTAHMKQHPEDAPQANKPHKCPLCFRSFSTNALLICHVDNCHRNNSKQIVNTAYNL